MAAELYLCVTDTDPTPLNLLDRQAFRTPRQFSAPGGSGSSSLVLGRDKRIMRFPVICLGPTPAVNWQQIQRKLYEAPLGAGPWGLAGSNIVLRVKYAGETAYSFVDVVDYEDPAALELYGVGDFQALTMGLICLPYVRSLPITYSGFTIAAGGNGIWIDNIPGDVPALARIQITDTSSGGKNINGIILGRHDHPLLVQGDLNPYLSVTAQSPGVDGGGYSSLVGVGTTWQAVCRASGPTSGKFNRRGILIAEVRDSTPVLGLTTKASLAVSTITAGGGSLPNAIYSAFLVPKNSTNLGTPSNPVSATVANLNPGGSTAVSTSVLFYDRDGTSDFRYWSRIDPTATASVAHSDWNSVSSPVFDFSTATNSYAAAGVNGIGSASNMIVLPKLPASGILSLRVRFKFTGAITIPSTVSNLRPLIWCTNAGSTSVAGLQAHNIASALVYEAYGFSGAASFASTTWTPDTNWHVLEITTDTTSTDARQTLNLDGVPIIGATITAANVPTELYIAGGSLAGGIYVGEISFSDQYLGNTLSLASGSSITYGLIHASGAGGTYGDLFLQQGAGPGWYKVPDVGNVSSYTLSQWPPPSSTLQAYPVITPKQPTQLRASVGTQATTPTLSPGGVRLPRLSNNAKEWVDFGGFDLPPVPIRQGGTPEPWVIEIECENPTYAATLDVFRIVVLDELRERTELSSPTLATKRVWDFDTRADGEVGCVLRSTADATDQGRANVTAPFHLGPGGTMLAPLLTVNDGNGNQVVDDTNATATVSVTVTPRFLISGGV